MVIFAERYIKTLVKTKLTHKELKKELKDYSSKFDFELEETVYYFILKIIKLKLYFDLDIKEYDEILYDAIYWSSKEENKKKTRPKTAKEIKLNKDVNKFVYLQKEMIKLVNITFYGKNDLLEDEYLIKYMTIFFELSSIKRDRR